MALIFSKEKVYESVGGKDIYEFVRKECGVDEDVYDCVDMMPVVGVTIDGSSMYIVEAEDGTMYRVNREWCVEGEPRAFGAWVTYDDDEGDERIVNMILERDDDEDEVDDEDEGNDGDDNIAKMLEKATGIVDKIARLNEIANTIKEDVDGNGDMTIEEFFALMFEGFRLSEETGKEIDEL